MANRGHTTLALAKFDKAVLRDNGLACPFAPPSASPFAPEDTEDKSVACCHRIKGWETIGKLREHVLRKHGSYYGCEWCGETWTPLSQTKARARKAEHEAACVWEARRQKNPHAKHSEERLTADQQKAVDLIKKLQSEEDLERYFVACGKPVPDCYHVRPLVAPEPSPIDPPAEALSPIPTPTPTSTSTSTSTSTPASTPTTTPTHLTAPHQPNLFRGLNRPEVLEEGVVPSKPTQWVSSEVLKKVLDPNPLAGKNDSGYEGSEGMPNQAVGHVPPPPLPDVPTDDIFFQRQAFDDLCSDDSPVGSPYPRNIALGDLGPAPFEEGTHFG